MTSFGHQPLFLLLKHHLHGVGLQKQTQRSFSLLSYWVKTNAPFALWLPTIAILKMKAGFHCFIVNKSTSPDSHKIAPHVLSTSNKRVRCLIIAIKDLSRLFCTCFKLLLVLYFAAFLVAKRKEQKGRNSQRACVHLCQAISPWSRFLLENFDKTSGLRTTTMRTQRPANQNVQTLSSNVLQAPLQWLWPDFWPHCASLRARCATTPSCSKVQARCVREARPPAARVA